MGGGTVCAWVLVMLRIQGPPPEPARSSSLLRSPPDRRGRASLGRRLSCSCDVASLMAARCFMRAMLGGWVVALVSLSIASPAMGGEAPAKLSWSTRPGPEALANILWERSPRLRESRRRIAEAKGEAHRTHLLPNPEFEFSWNTIPFGDTNPIGLRDPFANVPNYVFGLSQRIELGKRGPRQRAAASVVSSVLEDARAELFDAYFDLVERVAAMGTAEIRIASITALAEDARKLTELQRVRAEKGDAAQLDVDRAALEEEKLVAFLAEERSRLAQALRECEQILGLRCEPFGSSEAARVYLDSALRQGADLDQRPDIRALGFQREAAEHALSLAQAQAIPDPTVRFGYVHDRFLESGNHMNSFYVGVSFPLPFFDHGQADARVAEELLDTTGRARELLIEQTQAQLSAIREQRAALAERRRRFDETTIPLAQSVVVRLEELVARGGAALPDLLLARRTLGELVAESADLELSAFILAIAEARLRGDGPPSPPALQLTP